MCHYLIGSSDSYLLTLIISNPNCEILLVIHQLQYKLSYPNGEILFDSSDTKVGTMQCFETI